MPRYTSIRISAQRHENLKLLRSEIVRDAGSDNALVDKVASLEGLIEYLVNRYRVSATGHDEFLADLYTVQKADRDLTGLTDGDIADLQAAGDRLYDCIGAMQAEQSVIIQAVGRLKFRINEREVNNE